MSASQRSKSIRTSAVIAPPMHSAEPVEVGDPSDHPAFVPQEPFSLGLGSIFDSHRYE